MQSSFHDFLDLGSRYLFGTTSSRSIINQRRRARFQETVAPKDHRRPAGLQLDRNLPIRGAVRRRQNDARTENYFLLTAIYVVDEGDPGFSILAV